MNVEAVSHVSGLSYERFQELAPAARLALQAMGKAVDDSGLEKELTELLKLRVSQINQCAFCIQFHLNIARRLGVPGAKLDLVAAWRDAGIFSSRELAALAWAEHVTRLEQKAETARLYSSLHAEFAEEEIVHLTVAIANINAWNRIAGTLHFPPPLPRGA